MAQMLPLQQGPHPPSLLKLGHIREEVVIYILDTIFNTLLHLYIQRLNKLRVINHRNLTTVLLFLKQLACHMDAYVMPTSSRERQIQVHMVYTNINTSLLECGFIGPNWCS